MTGHLRNENARQLRAQGYTVQSVSAITGLTTDQFQDLCRPPAAPGENRLYQRYRENRAHLRGELNCAQCGKEFVPGVPPLEVGDLRFCKEQCARAHAYPVRTPPSLT